MKPNVESSTTTTPPTTTLTHNKNIGMNSIPTNQCTPKNKSIADVVFPTNGGVPPETNSILTTEVRSTTTLSHFESKEDNNRSIPRTVVACDTAQARNGNKYGVCNPSEFRSHREVRSMDKTVVQMVVTDQFFPEVKFADKDFELAWDDGPQSFCQYFISMCKVPVDIDRKEWWHRTRRIVAFTMCQTRNDRTTAVKNAFVGKYNGNAYKWSCFCDHLTILGLE